ncbi:MAG: hypothetical protein MHMPM18_000459 [Marteilia pararefringens]
MFPFELQVWNDNVTNFHDHVGLGPKICRKCAMHRMNYHNIFALTKVKHRYESDLLKNHRLKISLRSLMKLLKYYIIVPLRRILLVLLAICIITGPIVGKLIWQGFVVASPFLVYVYVFYNHGNAGVFIQAVTGKLYTIENVRAAFINLFLNSIIDSYYNLANLIKSLF